MTRKHFEEMAAYIRTHKLCSGWSHSFPPHGNVVISPVQQPLNAAFIRGMISMAVHMGRLFNENFDEERFMKACQLPEER